MLLIPSRLLGPHLFIPLKVPNALLTTENGAAFLTTEDGLPLA